MGPRTAARTARRLATSGHSSLSRHQNSQMAGWRTTPVCRKPRDEAVIRRPQRAPEVLRSHCKRQLEEKLRATDYGGSYFVYATGKGTREGLGGSPSVSPQFQEPRERRRRVVLVVVVGISKDGPALFEEAVHQLRPPP